MTAEERETVIQWDDACEMASVWTCHKAIAQNLRRQGLKPEGELLQSGNPVAWLFKIPKEWVSIKPPRKPKTGPGRESMVLNRNAVSTSKTARITLGAAD